MNEIDICPKKPQVSSSNTLLSKNYCMIQFYVLSLIILFFGESGTQFDYRFATVH